MDKEGYRTLKIALGLHNFSVEINPVPQDSEDVSVFTIEQVNKDLFDVAVILAALSDDGFMVKTAEKRHKMNPLNSFKRLELIATSWTDNSITLRDCDDI